MPVWSSPFPCRVPDGWEPAVPFPGPAGSLLVFDTPDWVLQSWGRDDQCDGAELERFEQGCQELLKLREQDSHVVQPCWADGAAPSADGITACLLMLVLQSNTEALTPGSLTPTTSTVSSEHNAIPVNCSIDGCNPGQPWPGRISLWNASFRRFN